MTGTKTQRDIYAHSVLECAFFITKNLGLEPCLTGADNRLVFTVKRLPVVRKESNPYDENL